MKTKDTVLLILMIMLSVGLKSQSKIDVAKQMDYSARQYKKMLAEFQDTTLFPQSVNPDGSYNKKTSEWWCSGFFAGSLWYLYELTQDEDFKRAAEKWTMAVKNEQFNTGTHDLGFMLYNSFGNGYRLTGNEAYKPVMLIGAQSLSTRFDAERGVIKSWNKFQQHDYPVIIDNMMNLEFLFWAAKTSGDKRFYDISVAHADKTLANHFRDDNSSFHVVCYDDEGNVEAKKTAQGFADASAWARGQAWGLYGYVVMYRETNDMKYLDQAVKIADFYMRHPNLPVDKVPYWDFNAEDIPNTVRDASAAAITASALLELSEYVNPQDSERYFKFAESSLENLSGSEYYAVEGNNYFLLKHSTGHKPKESEVDVPLVYADYYYLEALIRYEKLLAKK